MKNVKNDPSPRSGRRWAGSRGGWDRPRHAAPIPRPRRRQPQHPRVPSAHPGLQASVGRFTALPLSHRPKGSKGRKMATGPRAQSPCCTYRRIAKKATARRRRHRPRRRSGPRARRRPPSLESRAPKTRIEARAGAPRQPEGKQRGRREAEEGAGARAAREPIG